jgi:hypothetical protein
MLHASLPVATVDRERLLRRGHFAILNQQARIDQFVLHSRSLPDPHRATP